MVVPTKSWTSQGTEIPLAINFSGSGDNVVVAGVAGQVVLMYRIALVVAAATALVFKDGTTPLSGPYNLGAGGSMVLDDSGNPWYSSSPGNALVINSSNAVQVGGTLWYLQL